MPPYITYCNGNVRTVLMKDGTKMHFLPDNEKINTEFPESMDITITHRCDGGCPWCYQNAGNLPHKSLRNYESLLRSIHSGCEAAIGGNDLTHPDLPWMLNLLREIGVIANITVSEKHFFRNLDLLRSWSKEGFIHGLGVSLDISKKDHAELLASLSEFPNAVIHTIAGIANAETYHSLQGAEKVLILGYKTISKGESYGVLHSQGIRNNITDIEVNLDLIRKWIPTVCFDNLACRQLHLDTHFDKATWQKHYMGDDGTFSFYLNLADGTYARSSLDPEKPINADNVSALFTSVSLSA